MALSKSKVGALTDTDVSDEEFLAEVHVESSDQLTEQQRAILNEFRICIREMGAEYKGRFPDDHTLIRFLAARGFQLEKALKMFESAMLWREENAVDSLRESFKYPEINEVKKFYLQFHHKTDKLGRPVYVEQLCKLDVDKLMEVTDMDRLLKYHIKEWEVLTDIKFPACSKKAGKHISTSFTIIDVKGVSVRAFTKKVRSFVREITHIDQDYYPEFLGTMFIINAPTMFKAVWQIIKPWLDKKTVSKIHVMSGRYHQKLLEFVEPGNLPATLGGTCCCPGGCEYSDAGPWQDPLYSCKYDDSNDAPCAPPTSEVKMT